MRRSTGVVIAAALVAALGVAWTVRHFPAASAPAAAQPIRVTTAYREFADTLGRRETLSTVLARAGITGTTYAALLTSATRLDARRLRPGLVFHFRQPVTDSAVDGFMVRLDPDRRLWYSRDSSGWTEREEVIPWEPQRVRTVGRITTSLYDAIDEAVPDSILPGSERQALAWAIADVYDWEVDFTRDIRSGDRFEVLYDRLVSNEGDIRFGRVLAVRVDVSQRPSYAFYFEPDSAAAVSGFYDDQGRSLKRAFLRAPLQFRRITSGFGGRMHPILHTYRQHEGVDYAAAYGTPVRATADGLVTLVGRDAGYGNMIELRHANGIRTRYGHLSSFARGLHSGERIGQGETIGYVGSTGLSTGPHLHYEFLVNGHPMNPQRTNAGAGAPVPKSLQSAFAAARQALGLELEPLQTSGAKSVD
ncbi:MAG: M23 family metallopeptidase [Acidobacteriota bacterium]